MLWLEKHFRFVGTFSTIYIFVVCRLVVAFKSRPTKGELYNVYGSEKVQRKTIAEQLEEEDNINICQLMYGLCLVTSLEQNKSHRSCVPVRSSH